MEMDASYKKSLSKTACNGHKEVVQLLLNGEADSNNKAGEMGYTLLHKAIFKDHKVVVQLYSQAAQ